MKAFVIAVLALLSTTYAALYANPLRLTGPDPFIVYDNQTSLYYFLTTNGLSLEMTAAATLDGLRAIPDRRVVYQDAYMVGNDTTWAPEVHNINGTWYIYYAQNFHPWVVTGGSDPFDAYSNPTLLYEDWGIDSTVLVLNNTHYLVWSCQRNLTGFANTVQSICISQLLTPLTIDTNNIGVISQPNNTWEQYTIGTVGPVNEGPQPLYWEGETYLTYSASFCGTAEYSIGLLHYIGGDPVSNNSWSKDNSGPVLHSDNGNYGTGHNGIFISPDGTELWCVFHAVQNPMGACDDTRATWAYKVNTTNFKEFGPIFTEIGYYNVMLDGPSGEPNETQSINDIRPFGGCDFCWSSNATDPLVLSNITNNNVTYNN